MLNSLVKKLSLSKLTGSKSSKKSSKKTRSQKPKNSIDHRKKSRVHSHLKKYKSRPSPNTSATMYKVGTVKKGNDGCNYVVVSTKRKSKMIKRWVKSKSTKRSSSKRLKKTKKMKGGSCKVSMGQESGFNISDTISEGSPKIDGLRIGSKSFEIGRSCNTSNSTHAMVV
jgi:hypothetical protein